MSLLNDVLRDLASRNAPEPIPAVRPVARASAFRPPPWLAAAGAGMLLAVAGGWLALHLFHATAPSPRRPAVSRVFRAAEIRVPEKPRPARPTAPPSPDRAAASAAPPAAASAPTRKEHALVPARPPRASVPETAAASPRRAPPHLQEHERPALPSGPRPAPSRVATILPARSSLLRIERRILRQIHAGARAEAWALARRSAPARPTHHPRYLRLYAAVAASAGHWRAATHLYGLLCRLEPHASSAWSGLGVSLLAAGHPGRARSAIRRALALGVPNAALRRYLRREQRLLRTQAPTR